MRNVDLSRADLWGARFDRVRLEDARLVLRGPAHRVLTRGTSRPRRPGRARLAKVRAEGAHFESARLDAADLEDAHPGWGDPPGRRPDRCSAGGGQPGRGRPLACQARWGRLHPGGPLESRHAGAEAVRRPVRGCPLQGADLSRCDLEGMELPGASFAEADLSHALLTGSRMPGANFRGARLRAAGLAEVDWERADLRGADLREAAFHLGSSRSGLVGSPIACEGSRTGFYTDDYNEQDFKSPEEIRKANLRRCRSPGSEDRRGGLLPGRSSRCPDRPGADPAPPPLRGDPRIASVKNQALGSAGARSCFGRGAATHKGANRCNSPGSTRGTSIPGRPGRCRNRSPAGWT